IFIPIDDANLENTRAALKKLAKNVFVEYLYFYVSYILSVLYGVRVFGYSRSNSLKKLLVSLNFPNTDAIVVNRTSSLSLSSNQFNEKWLNPYVNEASFNSWIEDRKSVELFGRLVCFSGAQLFKLFNSGRSEMVQLLLNNVRQESTRELLDLLGITYIRRERAFISTMKDSCMFVLKEDDEVDEEFYGPIFLGDPMTEPGYFDEPPLCVLFIVYNSMRLSVRRWAASTDTDHKGYCNELAIEKFDENGKAVDGMIEPNGAYNVSIADLWRDTEKYEKLPPRYFRIEE
ncbi:hypothetical protein PRIPAC_90231, partial [Pristionchus pacificus]|uniref:Uncharacterized protein n=1 Tax=Pristionchus pacificus TaxID=54126 RepID=A0A2A6CIN1_PRIPA